MRKSIVSLVLLSAALGLFATCRLKVGHASDGFVNSGRMDGVEETGKEEIEKLIFSETHDTVVAYTKGNDENCSKMKEFANSIADKYPGVGFFEVDVDKSDYYNTTAKAKGEACDDCTVNLMNVVPKGGTSEFPVIHFYEKGEFADVISGTDAIDADAVSAWVKGRANISDCNEHPEKYSGPTTCKIVRAKNAKDLDVKVRSAGKGIYIVDLHQTPEDRCPNCTAFARLLNEDVSKNVDEWGVSGAFKIECTDAYGCVWYSKIMAMLGNASTLPFVGIIVDGKLKAAGSAVTSSGELKELIDEAKTGSGNTPSGGGGDTPGGGTGTSELIELNSDAEFTEKVLNSTGYVVVDFYKGQCVLCYWAHNDLENYAKDGNHGNIKFYEVQSYGTNWDDDYNSLNWNNWRSPENAESRADFEDSGYTDTGNDLETYHQILEWMFINGHHLQNEKAKAKAFFDKGKVGRNIAYMQTSAARTKAGGNYTPTIALYKNGQLVDAICSAEGAKISSSQFSSLFDKAK